MAQAEYSLTPQGIAAAAECHHGHKPPARAPRRKCRQCTREREQRMHEARFEWAQKETAERMFPGIVDRSAGWARFYSFYGEVTAAWADGCNCRLCNVVDRSERGTITRQEERQLLVLAFESIGAWHGDAAYSWEATSVHLDIESVAGRHSLPPDQLLRKSP